MATIRQCKNRLVTLLKIVNFFEENPFEQSFCGMSRRDALCLVQFYLKEQGFNLSVLTSLDFATRTGKKFRDAYQGFESSLKLARNAIAHGVEEIDKLPETAEVNLPLSQTLSQSSVPPELPAIMQEFQDHVLNTTGDSMPDPTKNEAHGQWGPAVLGRGMPLRHKWNKDKSTIAITNPQTGEQEFLRNEQVVSHSVVQILNEQLSAERKNERQARFEAQKTELAQKAIENAKSFSYIQKKTLTEDEVAKIQKIFHDVVEQRVSEYDAKTDTTTITREAEIWDNFVLNRFQSENKTHDDFSQQKREKDVANYYIEELVKRGISRPIAENIINQADLQKGITELSFIKYFNHVATDTTLTADGQQEKIGGLLAGKMIAAANQAVNAPDFNPTIKGQLITDAVFDTYAEIAGEGFSFLQAPDSVISQKLHENLQKKFYKKTIARGQNVTISPVALDAEIALEAKELLSRQTAAVAGRETGYHTIPIPGFVFLDEHQRTEILANKNLTEAIKTSKNFDGVLLKFRNRQVEQLDKIISEATERKLTQKQIDGLKEQKDVFLKFPTSSLLQENMLGWLGVHPIDGKKGYSPEELAFATKFIESWSNMLQNHKAFGGIINFVAKINSLQNSAIDKFIWGSQDKDYGRVGNFFRGVFMVPNVMAFQYIKAFLSAATHDFTVTPYYASVLIKSFVMGGLSLYAKGKVVGLVNRLIPAKFRGIFYVTDGRGMTHLTFLHPIQAAKVVWTKFWRGRVQAIANAALVWGGRLLGKEALAIALGGPIGAAFGAFWIIWDFLIPDWVKKALAWAAAGFIFLLINLWGMIWPILSYLLGPLGLLGGVLGLLIGGPLGALIGAGIGASLGTGLWLWFGAHTAPGWVMSLAPGWAGAGGIVGKFFGGISNIFNLGTGTTLAAPASTAALTSALVPVVTTFSGVFVGINFLWMAQWVPSSPQGVPGGLVAQNFTVTKSVTSTNTTYCPEFSTKKNCKNAVTLPENNTEFEYTLTITVATGKTINNIQIKDKVTILALGQCGINDIEKPCEKSVKPVKFELEPTIPNTSGISLPDDKNNNSVQIHYRIKLQDRAYMNSAIMNLIEVTAGGEKATNGTSFTIGTPPPSDCPVRLGQISCASLGSITHPQVGCQHGSDNYWPSASACSYAIPYMTGTKGNSISYPNATKCTNTSPTGEDYGFAADITPGINDQVFFPSLYGENLKWTIDGAVFSNNDGSWGYGAYYKATGADNSYRIYVTHLRQSDLSVSGGDSGTLMGTMCDKARGECSIDKHVHIEIVEKNNLSGTQTTLRPEFFCRY